LKNKSKAPPENRDDEEEEEEEEEESDHYFPYKEDGSQVDANGQPPESSIQGEHRTKKQVG
jgi:hypothetical protein